MTNFNYKKIISIVALFAILVLSVPLGGAHAQDENFIPGVTDRQQPTSAANPTEASKPKLDSLYQMVSQVQCSEAWFGPCITRFIAWIAFWILVLVSAFFQVFGIVFDLATAVTLDPQTYNLEPIRIGWSIARDTANLFFIFILLTISIATILQLETYGAKKLLAPLIIAAFFINFSFLATQYVIYSSNLLTAFFLPGVSDVQSSFAGYGPPAGSASKSLSVKFLAGVNPNAMFASANFGKGFEEIEKIQNRLAQVQSALKSGYDPGDPEREIVFTPEEKEGFSKEEKLLSNELKTKLSSKDFTTTTMQLGIAIMGTAVFILVAMFALAFAGIALLTRVVILWFLMILSPIAFLFFVIPGLSGEAQKWWQALLKQAFFAPGFFFLFGLTVEMISSGNAQALFKAAPKIDSAFITNFTLIGYYILLIIMLLASIAFAKSFGTYSGEWAINGARAARKYALGYAGRVARRYTAPVAGAVAGSQHWTAKALRVVLPFVGRGLSRFAAAGRGDVKEIEKSYEKYSNNELKNLIGQFGTPKDSQAAILNILASRKDLKTGGRMSSNLIKGLTQHGDNLGMGKETKVVKDLLYQYAQTDEDWQTVGKKLNPAQVPDLSGSFFENDKAMDSLIKNGNLKHIEKIIDARTMEEQQRFFAQLITNANKYNKVPAGQSDNSVAAITKYLEAADGGNNQKLAQQLQDPGFYKVVIGSHIKYPPAPPTAPQQQQGGQQQPGGGGQQPSAGAGGQAQQPTGGTTQQQPPARGPVLFDYLGRPIPPNPPTSPTSPTPPTPPTP